MSLLVALLLATAPDAGPVFRDSAVGRGLAGLNVAALDERWVEGLSGEPLLLRVERKGDETAVALYALEAPATADAGPRFVERKRYPVPGSSRVLDRVEPLSLGPAGPALAVTTREDDPDDEPVTLTLVGKGPALLFQGSYLHDVPGPGKQLSLAPEPEGFALRDLDGDGVPELLISAEPKRLAVTGPGGPAEVEVGRHLRELRLRGGRYEPAGERYQDFLTPLPLTSKALPALADGDLRTGKALKKGQGVELALPAGTPVRLLRLVPCPKGGEPLPLLGLRLDDAAPLQLEGARSSDPRVLGSGEFDLGPGGGRQVLVFLEPPLKASRLTVTAESGPACLAEVTAH